MVYLCKSLLVSTLNLLQDVLSIVFDKMESLLKEYSEKAKKGLRKIPDSEAKNNLDNLIKFTMFKA